LGEARIFRVYKKAPGIIPALRERGRDASKCEGGTGLSPCPLAVRVKDASACTWRHPAFAMPPAGVWGGGEGLSGLFNR